MIKEEEHLLFMITYLGEPSCVFTVRPAKAGTDLVLDPVATTRPDVDFRSFLHVLGGKDVSCQDPKWVLVQL
jgi:hypothetical protein